MHTTLNKNRWAVNVNGADKHFYYQCHQPVFIKRSNLALLNITWSLSHGKLNWVVQLKISLHLLSSRDYDSALCKGNACLTSALWRHHWLSTPERSPVCVCECGKGKEQGVEGPAQTGLYNRLHANASLQISQAVSLMCSLVSNIAGSVGRGGQWPKYLKNTWWNLHSIMKNMCNAQCEIWVLCVHIS